tara:strand:- start:28477 stop:28806 length:330 start_codon:yes stop_codon:yes gene_type:complete
LKELLGKDEVLGWIDSTSDINDLVEVNKAVHDRAELVAQAAKETFSIGDWVKIQFRESERLGKVDKINRKTITVVRTIDGSVFYNPIKVQPYFLTKLTDSEAEEMFETS